MCLSIMCVCVIKKHVCLFSYRSIIATEWLGIAIHILGMMPRKSGESFVECYAMAWVSNSCTADKNITVTGCVSHEQALPSGFAESGFA